MQLVIRLSAILIMVTGSFFLSTGAVDISGDISLFEFSKEKNPYRVTGDIYVPSEKKVIIPAGVLFLFNALENITLRVEGSLVVHGTNDEPVIFTSSNDPQYNPDSLASVYDWAGIKISGSAQQVMLRCAVIKYARNPVETRIPTTRFENVQFSDNMYSQLIINGKEYDISQEQLFDYPAQISETSKHDTLKYKPDAIKLISSDTDSSTADITYEPEKSKWWHKKAVRLTILGAGIVTAGYGVAAIISSQSHADKHDQLMADFYNDDLPNNKRENAYYQAKDESKISNAMSSSAIASFAVSGVCVLGFVLTITF